MTHENIENKVTFSEGVPKALRPGMALSGDLARVLAAFDKDVEAIDGAFTQMMETPSETFVALAMNWSAEGHINGEKSGLNVQGLISIGYLNLGAPVTQLITHPKSEANGHINLLRDLNVCHDKMCELMESIVPNGMQALGDCPFETPFWVTKLDVNRTGSVSEREIGSFGFELGVFIRFSTRVTFEKSIEGGIEALPVFSPDIELLTKVKEDKESLSIQRLILDDLEKREWIEKVQLHVYHSETDVLPTSPEDEVEALHNLAVMLYSPNINAVRENLSDDRNHSKMMHVRTAIASITIKVKEPQNGTTIDSGSVIDDQSNPEQPLAPGSSPETPA